MKLKIVPILCLIIVCSTTIFGQEICNNGIDDDFDNLIDYNDSIDCFCAIIADNTVSSLIPNPSFEDTLCLPQFFSQMGCALDWIQASAATSDFWYIDSTLANYYYYYPYNLNFAFEAPTPIPDGDGFVGFINNPSYQEYIGACLLNPIQQDSSYTFEFSLGFSEPSSFDSDPITLSFYANNSCSNLPFGSYSSWDCPSNYPGWEEVAAIDLSGTNEWIDTSVTFIANSNYEALVIGGSCNISSSYSNNYYFLDNLIVNETNLFNVQYESIDSTKIDCNHYQIAIQNAENYAVQWFKNGIALVEDTLNFLEIQNDLVGNYFAQITGDFGCYISNSIFLIDDTIPQLYTQSSNIFDFPINTNQNLALFTDVANFEINWNNNVNLSCLNCMNPQFNAIQNDTLFAEIINTDNLCENFIELFISVFDTMVIDTTLIEIPEPLETEICNIYIPNVFTPNNDGKNEDFEIFIGDCYSKIIQFSIFNRFGERINDLSNTNITQSNIKWNGTFKNQYLSTDVFYYVLKVVNENGQIEDYKGNVTLVR